MRTAWLGWVFVALACTSQKRVESPVHPVIGPDGSVMLHLTCGTDEALCYELAGTHCSKGYDIFPTPRQNWLVRCRAAQPTWVARVEALAPSPYAIQETVQPWPAEPLAPSPYAPPNPPASVPPLTPGRPDAGSRDLGL
jgi:hypothetical protein